MASLTRSSRRAEARIPNDQNTNNTIAPMRSRPTANFNHAAAGGGGGGGVGEVTRGMKRGLDDADEIERPKKTRIAVEGVARDRSAAGGMKRKPATTGANAAANDKPAPQTQNTATQADDATDQNLTKHQAKVINGIKHELDRLQPQQGDVSASKEGGRKLRSQESSRYKSELAAYFPEYDEVIGNEEKEERK